MLPVESQKAKYMGKESPTSGLGPDELHRLLQICSEAKPAGEQIGSDQRKAELLQDFLAESLPVEAPKSNLSEQLTTLCKISGIASEESVRDMLTYPKTDVRLLRMIRDYFKKKSKCADPEAEHAATTIYYAAIAYALVVHNLKITKFSLRDLHNAFSLLVNTEWIPPVLSSLFGKACDYCQSSPEV